MIIMPTFSSAGIKRNIMPSNKMPARTMMAHVSLLSSFASSLTEMGCCVFSASCFGGENTCLTIDDNPDGFLQALAAFVVGDFIKPGFAMLVSLATAALSTCSEPEGAALLAIRIFLDGMRDFEGCTASFRKEGISILKPLLYLHLVTPQELQHITANNSVRRIFGFMLVRIRL